MKRSSACFLLLVIVLSSSLGVVAQSPPLETDRPDQTESPAVVPVGWVQFEAGLAREGLPDHEAAAHRSTLPTVLTKVGLFPWMELRVITERERMLHEQDGVANGVWLPLQLGSKVRLLQENGWRPRTSLIAHIGLPTVASEVVPDASIFGNFRFTMQHSLTDRLSLGYNLGGEWERGLPLFTAVYTVALGAQLNDHWGVYGEFYGWLNDREAADHRADAGITWLLTPDIQLDASAGHSFVVEQWFLSAGVSMRFAAFAPRTSGTGRTE